MTTLYAAGGRRGAVRWGGLALALISVTAPALPLGPLFAQPPLPLAALWAAYGWAADEKPGWGAPTALFALGLLHDQLAGGPYGLFPVLYLSAFLIGRVISNLASAPTLFATWGGFIITSFALIALAAVITRFAIGEHAGVRPFAEAVLITAILFPLTRALYMPGASSFGGRG
ncbi:MAG: hypothetical protein AB7L65_09880 [Hyphomonadaceae bacterium]